MDRNSLGTNTILSTTASLSARRAWIEISVRSQPSKPRRVALRKESVDRNALSLLTYHPEYVALRKESVDRNCYLDNIEITQAKSLSARRAWIEIASRWRVSGRALVALRKESVDRNRNSIRRCLMSAGRSPQGERG